MNTSILAEELAPLNAQIEQTGRKLGGLEGELGRIEAELETFAADRQRFAALQEVCDALDKLAELQAAELFWKDLPRDGEAAAHLQRLRGDITGFEAKISGTLEKQTALQEQIEQCGRELDILHDQASEAYDREERRREEFVLEREISAVPFRAMVMPWTREAESERRLRNAVLVALLACFVLGTPASLINLPIPDRAAAVVEIPKRLAKLVKPEPPKLAALPKPAPKPAPPKPEKARAKPKKAGKKPQKSPAKPQVAREKPAPQPKPPEQPAGGRQPAPKPALVADSDGGAAAARQKAQSVGVLAFKDAFADLMKETPVAKLGVEASLNNNGKLVKGRAVAQRSLVAVQAQGGGSGGIGNATVSRNIGNGNVDRLGGIGIGMGSGNGTGDGAGFGRVESAIAGLGESARPLSGGLAAGRTDEEIQIVFDRYKATLYRIYNNELRKDPSLRGKILMRITIEPDGAVSLCKVESTDLGSPQLVDMIVARIRRFDFGAKEDVQKMTILYPIDFLPAG